jgi:NAD(P)-dependent dehydrogenase (short-subunit alcohol dehydrogenase family)
MGKSLDGKVALVTGAATGIGRTIALTFAREGAKVVVNTRSNVKDGEAVVEEIKKAGGDAIFVKADVSKEAEVEAMIAETVKTYGRLDYAANNAGVGPDGKRLPIVDIDGYTEELWDAICDTNLKGAMFCMKHEIRQFLKQGGGSICNTSSVSALNTSPGFAAYNASKAGLCKLTQIAAVEYATRNIRANCVLPGPIKETLLTDNLLASDPGAADMFIRHVPMRRLGVPIEIAEMVVFLCSDKASFITGHSVPIDGGMTLMPND